MRQEAGTSLERASHARLVSPSHGRPAAAPLQVPVKEQVFKFMPNWRNPYERPQENAIDVLEAHLNPRIEDALRYGRL